MSNTDIIQRFLFEENDIRGEIVRLEDSFQAIVKQHDYPLPVSKLLGEVLVATVLLRSILKFKGDITVQFSGEGPLKMLVAKCNHLFHVRALAQFDDDLDHNALQNTFANGRLVVTAMPENKITPYQSIIEINGQSISEAIEQYFGQSEQLSTRVMICANETTVAGMLLQLMPEQSSQAREHFWEYATMIQETLSADELMNLDNSTILHRLYHEDDIRLFDADHVRFQCHCDVEKMRNAIRVLGQSEAMSLLKDRKEIIVNCEYCNFDYAFSKTEVENIF